MNWGWLFWLLVYTSFVLVGVFLSWLSFRLWRRGLGAGYAVAIAITQTLVVTVPLIVLLATGKPPGPLFNWGGVVLVYALLWWCSRAAIAAGLRQPNSDGLCHKRETSNLGVDIDSEEAS